MTGGGLLPDWRA